MKRTQKHLSVFLLAAFAVWQLNAAMHFFFCDHTIDSRGHVVHAHSDCDHEDHEHSGEDDTEHDDECHVISLLTSAKTKHHSGAIPTISAELQTGPSVVTPVDVVFPGGPDLFRLSPKNSPPSQA